MHHTPGSYRAVRLLRAVQLLAIDHLASQVIGRRDTDNTCSKYRNPHRNSLVGNTGLIVLAITFSAMRFSRNSLWQQRR